VSDRHTRIDFYVLGDADTGTRLRFACRLAEKAYGLEHRVHAFTDGEAEARDFDDLLWSFRAGSFVPHALGAPGGESPVTIGWAAGEDIAGDLLINLGLEVPACFDRFARVAEIVDASDDGRRAGRRRFAFYRDNGYAPQTHRIGQPT